MLWNWFAGGGGPLARRRAGFGVAGRGGLLRGVGRQRLPLLGRLELLDRRLPVTAGHRLPVFGQDLNDLPRPPVQDHLPAPAPYVVEELEELGTGVFEHQLLRQLGGDVLHHRDDRRGSGSPRLPNRHLGVRQGGEVGHPGPPEVGNVRFPRPPRRRHGLWPEEVLLPERVLRTPLQGEVPVVPTRPVHPGWSPTPWQPVSVGPVRVGVAVEAQAAFVLFDVLQWQVPPLAIYQSGYVGSAPDRDQVPE